MFFGSFSRVIFAILIGGGVRIRPAVWTCTKQKGYVRIVAGCRNVLDLTKYRGHTHTWYKYVILFRFTAEREEPFDNIARKNDLIVSVHSHGKIIRRINFCFRMLI